MKNVSRVAVHLLWGYVALVKMWIIFVFVLFTGLVYSQENTQNPPPPLTDDSVFGEISYEKSAKEKQDAFALVEEIQAALEKNGTPRLTILTEFIEIDQSDLNAWMADPKNKSDGADFRKYVSNLQNDGKATLLDMSIIAATSGQRANSESVNWHIFPRGIDKPAFGGNSGDTIVPGGYRDCETRKLGSTSWIEAVLGDADTYSPLLDSRSSVAPRQIGINLSPQYIEWIGETIYGKEESETRSQLFRTLQTYAQITVENGVPSLVSVVNRESDDTERPVLIFVRADVHRPQKIRSEKTAK